MQKQHCQICDREPNYICGECKIAAYCTNQHRIQHWRIHKEHCKVLRSYNELNREDQFKGKRSNLRKLYFQAFNNNIYDKALNIARELFKFEQQNVKMTRFILNEFQYGITVCLLCRTLIILNKKSQAKIHISEYLKEKQHFLQDLRDIKRFPDNESLITDSSKQFLKKKLELISAVANIYYSLGLPPIHFYCVYLEHIDLAFGSESLEASNCYFLIGTYYMQCREFNKSIACFVRTANIRGPKAGDCYINLAILYEMRGKPDLAIRFFEYALKLKQDQGDQNSIQIAGIFQSIAQIQIRNKNFINAIKSLEKSLKIYSNKNQMQEYNRIKQKIKILHNYIKNCILKQQKSLLPKQIQDQLVDKNMHKTNAKEINTDQLSFVEEKRKERFNLQSAMKFSENFLSRLSSVEIYLLSQLQIQLQTCNSEYAVAYTVANSEFMTKLSDNRLKDMKIQNEKLFELMNIQKRFNDNVVMKRD